MSTLTTMMAPEKKKKRRPRRKSEEAMTDNMKELHRLVREAKEKGFGASYGGYIASIRETEERRKKA